MHPPWLERVLTVGRADGYITGDARGGHTRAEVRTELQRPVE